MHIKHAEGAAGSLVHDGEVFAPDENGVFEVPFDLAATLLVYPFWEIAEPPVPVVAPEVPAPVAPEEPELTPAQKAAATRAANKAAAESEAE